MGKDRTFPEATPRNIPMTTDPASLEVLLEMALIHRN